MQVTHKAHQVKPAHPYGVPNTTHHHPVDFALALIFGVIFYGMCWCAWRVLRAMFGSRVVTVAQRGGRP